MITNLNVSLSSTFAGVLALCLLILFAVPKAHGQLAGSPTKQATDLVVDGRVVNIFQSGDESLVQIRVQRSEVPDLVIGSGTRYPAPGESVYVHVNQRVLPPSQSRIRAYLTIGEGNQWVGEGRGWYEESSRVASGEPDGRQRGRMSASPIGLKTERAFVSGKSALKVVEVDRNSPAAKAGIETGDILVEADGIALESQEQLSIAFRRSRGALPVTVRDVRSGREVVVNVENVAAAGSEKPRQELGVTSELAFYGGEAAVKVTKVQPNSPAQRAGIVPGLLILKANGKAVSSPAELQNAEKASRRNLELQIVDPKEKRERLVQITL